MIAAALVLAPGLARAADPPPEPAARDTTEHLQFTPNPLESEAPPERPRSPIGDREGSWARAPRGDDIITDIEPWHAAEGHHQDLDLLVDYNRVDPLRAGFGWRFHGTDAWMPRVGARVERAFGRNRTLYGAQFEQPIIGRRRLSIGATMYRRTDHNDLQQMSDFENSLALLLGRTDDRDYFEREGQGVYLALRVPRVTRASLRFNSDRYRSLSTWTDTRSWAHTGRPLRVNPAIDDGDVHALQLRFERAPRMPRRLRVGLDHWIEIERAGHGMGGDFSYTRALADVRSMLRLTPASTLSLRAVGGHNPDGDLPRQREFTVGGPDGLRAHPVDAFRGNRIALGQAEYDVGLWSMRGDGFENGIHALAFVDAGGAWHGTRGSWDPISQRFAADGGVGVATSDNSLRVYFAKDLHDAGRDVVISVRLQRPF
jgi:hypothetical protein